MIKFGIPFFSAIFGALIVTIFTAQLSEGPESSADTAAQITRLEQRISDLEAILDTDDVPPPGGMTEEEKRALFGSAGLTASAISAILANEMEIQQLFITAERTRQDPRAQVQEKLHELQLTIGGDAYGTYLEATGRDPFISVESVTAGSIAEMSGVLAGDRITHYAGERVFTPLDLERVAAGLAGTDSIALTLERADTEQQVEVTKGQLGIIAQGGYQF
ncbi:MAG: hypothetical protein Q7V56_07505 [Gammaproteobacteria bacterium]|nr:hypothetical protein [Gammaproteobacteria bacterium]